MPSQKDWFAQIQLKADKPAVLADDYAALGFVDSREAIQSQLTTALRMAYWSSARRISEEPGHIYGGAKHVGAVSGFEHGEPDSVGRNLANCDAMLAKLSASQ